MSPGESGSVTYGIFAADEPFVAEDPWNSLIRDAKESSPKDAFLTIRTFGLEGRVEFNLEGDTLVWGGSLIDLACWLNDWTASRPSRAHFEPLEQANNLTLSTDGDTIVFSSMGQRVGQLPAADTLVMIDQFLRDLAREIATKAPVVQELSDMSWVATRS